MDFNQEYAKRVSVINESLKSFLIPDSKENESIFEAMEYSVSAGGKRIRPVLMMSVYEMLGYDYNDIMNFAAAIEMIHTYSLIHDDLPAMDDSDLRRGRPTNHVVYGEAMGVLSGDALLNRAFEVMAKQDKINAEYVLKALGFIADCSGVIGMIGGQVMDISYEGQSVSIETLKELHRKKTGALIKASVCTAAILAGIDKDKYDVLEKYADYIGLAFQIKDDILDVKSDASVLGKPVGNDEKHLKNTYVSILGLDEAEKLLAEYTDKAKECLTVWGDKAEFLEMITDYLLERKN